jgi:ribosomal protein L37AE/L43A
MQKRQLRIIKRTSPTIGVCERCNAQFKSSHTSPSTDIQAQFDAHKCKPMNTSQNSLRIVREATENK